MNRFEVSLCLAPQISSNGIDYKPEDQFRLSLGNITTHVDHFISHATPRRISNAISNVANNASAFTHQINIIVGTKGSKDTLVMLLSDLINSHHSNNNNNNNNNDDIPLQCMIFASDDASVVCEIIGKEEMTSVKEVISGMHQIVLVALKYKYRTLTIVVVEQLSTTLISAMLGNAWCNLWIILNGEQTIEYSQSILREALAVREAVKGFRYYYSSGDFALNSKKYFELFLQARATSDTEAEQFISWWQQNNNNNNNNIENKKEENIETLTLICERLANENTELQSAQSELQTHLTEREEYFTKKLEENEQEIYRLKYALKDADLKLKKSSKTEERIIELESQLAIKEKEVQNQIDLLVNNKRETDKRIQQIHFEYNSKIEKLCHMNNTYNIEENRNSLKRELSEVQAELNDLQNQWNKLKEENMQNVIEFHEKEKIWQKQLKQEIEEKHIILEECNQLRNTINYQGSSMNTVKEAIQATRALQEEELDDLLIKIKAISSVNSSIEHRRVSPRPSVSIDFRNRIRMLSPASVEESYF